MERKWYGETCTEKKNHSTSIENHGVVKKQLGIRFEFFVTPVLSFVHLLHRATQSSITQTGLEHGDTAQLSGWTPQPLPGPTAQTRHV